ncbi:MAG: DHA2 family efflux MFS transporter permease subunit [Spongiibacteraceae bacterium]
MTDSSTISEPTEPEQPLSTQPAPLHGARLMLGSVALSLATFMNVLDTSIANVSVPSIAGDLGVSPNQGTWVITSFAVSVAISVPLTGWLTQRFGAVRLFVLSVVLFVLASLLCGLAPSLGTLVLFRVIQGAVAGPMIPLSQTLMLSTYPPEKSGTAMLIWSMTTLVAPVVGPILGGWISDNYSWPWIFYINVPLGLAAAWVVWRIYRDRETPTQKKPIDRMGLVLLVVWVGCLQLMLDKGKDMDWFSSPVIIALASISCVGFVFFVIWELTDEHPVVDLLMFKERNFLICTIAIALGYGVYFGNIVILPLWLQTELGYTATRAGLVLAPMGVLAVMVAPVISRAISRWDPRWLVTFAFTVFAFVSLLRSEYTTQVDYNSLLWPSLIQGLGLATFFVPLTVLSLGGLHPSRIAAATGLSNFARLLFGGFGASVSTTLWEDRVSMHHARLTESSGHFNPIFNQTVDQLQHMGLSAQQALGQVEHMVSQQAGMLGLNDIVWASSILFFILGGVVWFTKPIRSVVSIDSGGAH